ncbi:MAG TPA: HIT domain-containing protein [Gaiellaceae bacterium]|nr:HIT domain-containing protein [Gaiellaceae bacterium]
MTKPLWAPWRLEYVQQAHEAQDCVFCREASGELEGADTLLVRRGAVTVAILNKYPYSSGHLLLAPVRHVASLAELRDEETLELHRLAATAMDALVACYAPDGFNLGWNLGHVAGAGIVDHVHLHVVPRWSGDTNFMPVLADVKVLPEHLLTTREKLRAAWPTA